MNLVMGTLTVAEMRVSQTGTEVLIGTDVLEKCQFLYDGPADSFSLTY
jgi:hypothetical protein